jgi:hypothetical protein
MDWWEAQERRLGRAGALLAAYCAIVGLVSAVVYVGSAVDGEVPAASCCGGGSRSASAGCSAWPGR